MRPDAHKTAEVCMQDRLEQRRLLAHKFFFGYAYELFRHTSLYLQWRKVLTAVRRLRTVTFVLRILTVTVTILETGAAVILATALCLVLLPLLVALMLGILITAAIESRQKNKKLSRRFAGKSVCILFLPDWERQTKKETATVSSPDFFTQNAYRLAAEGYGVIVVAPYWLSPRGLTAKGHFYCTARQEAPNVYLIRRYYFFSLHKHVLKQAHTVCLF